MQETQYDIAKRMLQTMRESPNIPVNTNGTLVGLMYNTDKPLSEDVQPQQSSGEIVVNNDNFPGVADGEKDKILQQFNNIHFDNNFFKLNPQKKTVSIDGTMPNLSNLRFKMTTDTSDNNGLFLFVEGLKLTDDALDKLQRLKSYYDIFSNEYSYNAVEQKFKQSKNQDQNI